MHRTLLSGAPAGGIDCAIERPLLTTVHILAGIDDAHGGPSYSVPRLCEALGDAQVAAALYSVDIGAPPAAEQRGYRDCRFAWNYKKVALLREIRSSSALTEAVQTAAATADVIHNHGLWLMPNVAAGRAALRAGTPLVVSPRGMLAPAALAF